MYYHAYRLPSLPDNTHSVSKPWLTRSHDTVKAEYKTREEIVSHKRSPLKKVNSKHGSVGSTLNGDVSDRNAELHVETIAANSLPENKATLAKPVVAPISLATTYEVEKCDDFADAIKNEYVYSRFGNHTCQATAEVINKLEGGVGGLLFASGMAAITTSLLATLNAGDHLVIRFQ
ncbi:cystathionine gamma-lyase-like [Ptychodera flava]|uniref:cystathionine gamma-lyase-like n=1 Tax=Ptychodera flava TaxID=63121 RepID=UPI003969C157